jgi:hypothetical protein
MATVAAPPDLRKMRFCRYFDWKPWEYDQAPTDLIVLWDYMRQGEEAMLARVRAAAYEAARTAAGGTPGRREEVTFSDDD